MYEYSDDRKGGKDPWRFKLENNLDHLDNSSDSEERNLKLLKREDGENSDGEQQDDKERLDDPSLYFGEKAKDSFWDFYKSDRKFKDFDLAQNPIEDPR